jgi:hypothetical protein
MTKAESVHSTLPTNTSKSNIGAHETANHFPLAFDPPADLKEIPSRFADFATDSGVRPSAFATASSDFSESASAIKRRSSANDRPPRSAIYFEPFAFSPSSTGRRVTATRLSEMPNLSVREPDPRCNGFHHLSANSEQRFRWCAKRDGEDESDGNAVGD